MKKVLVKTSGDVEIQTGEAVILAGDKNGILEVGNQKIFISGLLTEVNGVDVDMEWSLTPKMLEAGATLRGVVPSGNGWNVFLHCAEKIKLKPTTELLRGRMVEPILLRRISDDFTASGTRLL